MPPRPQQIQHEGEGRWDSGIFALLLWQFTGALLVECYMVFGIWVGHCFAQDCRPLESDDIIFISIIILNFLMLVLIWNEMLLWTQDSLFVNRFLVSELGKMMLVLPFPVFVALEFFWASNKWNALSWAFWSLIVIPGPYFLALIIAVVAKYQTGRTVQASDEERRPLFARHDGPASPEAETRGAALQEPSITSL